MCLKVKCIFIRLTIGRAVFPKMIGEHILICVVRIVINGAGAAAVSITKLLLSAGAGDVTLCDRKGAIYAGRSDDMNWIKEEMAQVTNPEKRTGSLVDVLAGADVFIGVSAPGAVTKEMVQTMNEAGCDTPFI